MGEAAEFVTYLKTWDHILHLISIEIEETFNEISIYKSFTFLYNFSFCVKLSPGIE